MSIKMIWKIHEQLDRYRSISKEDFTHAILPNFSLGARITCMIFFYLFKLCSFLCKVDACLSLMLQFSIYFYLD